MLQINFKLILLGLIVVSGSVLAGDQNPLRDDNWRCKRHTYSRAGLLARSGIAIAGGVGTFCLASGTEIKCFRIDGECECIEAPVYPEVVFAGIGMAFFGLHGLKNVISYRDYVGLKHREYKCLTDHKDPADRA